MKPSCMQKSRSWLSSRRMKTVLRGAAKPNVISATLLAMAIACQWYIGVEITPSDWRHGAKEAMERASTKPP